ncbi:type II secretion system secretin GspD [uncultured Thiocystis sp.]|jgi:general secretion pathway protein D|uniref:type II secretion system secretin GspD n=1 Tax=uncultured Thiocystis sp. TaxID=1202134 RepID=UPI0025DAAC66|nr:type II secretion system secretin GspD [uncultured Thiocystis sp.]
MYSNTYHLRRIQDGRWLRAIVLVGFALYLSACERSYWDPTVKVGDPGGHIVDRDQSLKRDAFKERGGTGAETIALGGDDAGAPKTVDSLQRGSGTFVRKITPPSVDTTPGDVTLNFDGTDIREVVKVILGDLLKVNYVLHPSVQGVTSLQTGRPLRREHLIPTLETLLRMNNAAIVFRDGTYEVVPVANAIQGKVVPQLGESTRALPQGYSIQVVPLRYIGAEEMSSILQPLAPEGSVIRIDNLRNLVVIAGTSPEMGNLLDTIRVFDVDWMSGLSVGFFVLEFAKANEVVTQLQSLLADEGGNNPLKGLFRFVPIESANALLVVSPQERYIQQARNWIERLDMAEASGDAAERLFVYRVKHGDAGALADILSELFGGASSSDRNRSKGSVAPGLERSSIGSKKTADATNTDSESNQSNQPLKASSREIEMSSSVSIVADAVNNSLLVRSNPRDFKKILDALKQLDIVPLQVLVEATIVEITLTGNLQYGVQWELFGPSVKGKAFASLDGSLDDATTAGIKTSFPGFNWALISNPGTIRATLSALAGENLVNVLSSPSVMVLDNQTAKIQVGQEVPVATSQQQSTSTTDRVINTIEYRDTGVMLSVKPRVTPGGLVQMEIEQEVSTVAPTKSSTLDSPTFQTRNITSSVAVRSNQAVVLGGLIQDQRTDGKQGVPGLYSLPFVGALFGERTKQADRTELVVVLTPKVISSDQDIESVTEDFRSKVRGLNFKF